MSELNLDVHIVEKDIVAFNVQVLTQPEIQNRKWRTYLIFSGVVAAVSVLLAVRGEYEYSVVVFVAGAFYIFLLYLIWSGFLKRRISKNVRFLINTGRSDTLFGDRTIRITPEVIESRGETGYNGTYWKSVDRMEVTEEYAFIFTSGITGIILPRREVSDEEFHQFIELVESCLNAVEL